MKASWVIEGGALKVTVKDGRREQIFTFRKTQTAQSLAIDFQALAQALNPAPLVMRNRTPYRGTVFSPDFSEQQPPEETPERIALRRAAAAAAAGAQDAKAIQAEDEATVAKLPEVIARESAKQQTDTHGFETLSPPSAAIDGTIYTNKDYRSDKSNWVN